MKMEEKKIPKKENKDAEKLKIKQWLKINKPLIPLKIILFCWNAATSTLYPYITIHLKQKGLSVAEASAIYTFLPIPLLLGPPFIGMVADKLGRHKMVLVVILGSVIALSLGILFIPEIPNSSCSAYSANFTCTASNNLKVQFDYPCNGDKNDSFGITVDKCRLQCREIVPKQNEVEMCIGNHCDTLHLKGDNSNVTLKFINLNESCGSRELIKWNNYSVDSDQCKLPGMNNCNLTCDLKYLENGTDFDTDVNCVYNWEERFPTIVMSFIFVLLFKTLNTTCYRFMDVTNLIMTKKYNGDFGRERIWYSIASAIFSPLSGYLIDVISDSRGRKEYFPAFYMYVVLVAITMVMVTILKLEMVTPSKNMSRKGMFLLKKPEVWLLLIALFCLGTVKGIIGTFLSWFLVDLQSPIVLIGLRNTVGHLISIPFLLTSTYAIKKIGHVNILVLSFFVCAIYLLGYSYLYNPWLALIFGIFKPFASIWMWIATVKYCADLAPEGLIATVQGIAGGIYNGVGRGSGSLIGGALWTVYGPRIAFRVLAIMSAVCGILYVFAYYYILPCCRRKKVKVTTVSSK